MSQLHDLVGVAELGLAAPIGGPVSAQVPAALVVGNPKPDSRTHAVARHVAGAIRDGLRRVGVSVGEPDLVDLSALAHAIPLRFAAAAGDDDPVARALRRVQAPGILIVASPTFKGSYTGLLKLFLDLLPQGGLTGTVAVPLMTAAWSAHRFVADSHLRALLVELGAAVPATGLSVLEREFAEVDSVVAAWAAANLPILAAVLTRAGGAPAAISPVRRSGYAG